MGIIGKKINRLEDEIERIHEAMKSYDPLSDEYKKLSDILEKLYREKAENGKNSVQPKDIIPVGACFALGIMTIFAENTRAVTSKAMQFVTKGIRL